MEFDAEYMELVYDEIERVLQKAMRDLKRPALPKDVQPRLPYNRAEGSLRRDMAEMERRGRLVRVGGPLARQGYRLPTALEKLSWRLNGGLWPWGADRLRVPHY